MAKQMADERNAKAQQQEELFGKIKGELFNSLTDNFRRVEAELAQIKSSKAIYEEQIQSAIKGLSTNANPQPLKSVEHMINEQSKQLDNVKQTIGEDIIRIREAV